MPAAIDRETFISPDFQTPVLETGFRQGPLGLSSIRLSAEETRERAIAKMRLAQVPENDTGARLHDAMVAFCELYQLDPLQHVDAWESRGKLIIRPNAKGMQYIGDRSGRVVRLRVAVYPRGACVLRDSAGIVLTAPGQDGTSQPIFAPPEWGMVGEYEIELRQRDGDGTVTTWGQLAQSEWQTSEKAGSAWGSMPKHMLTMRTKYRAIADELGVEPPPDIDLTREEIAEIRGTIGGRMAQPAAPKDTPDTFSLLTQLEQLCDLAGKDAAEWYAAHRQDTNLPNEFIDLSPAGAEVVVRAAAAELGA